MIKDFKLKEDFNIKPQIFDNNDLIKIQVCDPIAKLYKKGIKVGNTWEMIDVDLRLSPFQPYLHIFRDVPMSYLEKEHKWYMSQDLSIKGWMDDIKIWQFCASKDDKQEINSNYGWCVFSEANGNQYENCLKKLQADPNSREAMLIYTRPSIHHDAVENGKHDFICTNYSHFFIRNNRLEMIHSQRSADGCTGVPFDFAWSCFVYQMLYEELRHTYPDLKVGLIHYHIDSLHIYERSEHLLKKYLEENPNI